jgi:hypothetical protein
MIYHCIPPGMAKIIIIIIIVKIMEITGITEGVDRLEPSRVAGAVTVESSLVCPQKVESGITTDSSFAPRYITKRTEKICSHKNMYVNAYSNIIQNSREWKPIKMAVNG